MKAALSLFLVLFSQSSLAQTCWDLAGKRYGIDAWLLFAIAEVESTFTPKIKRLNTNLSHDLGLMQVNTIHKKALEKQGIDLETVRNDDCTNIMVGASLLKDRINEYGLNIDGIGAYHSKTTSKRRAYGKKVLERYQVLTQRYYVNKEPFSFEYHKNTPYNKKKVNQPVQKISKPVPQQQYFVSSRSQDTVFLTKVKPY